MPLLIAAAGAAEPPQDTGQTLKAVEIHKVKVDRASNTMTITGKNFLVGDFVSVHLGGDPVPLTITMVNDTTIVIDLPGVIEAGDYLLEVFIDTPDRPGAVDDFDVTIPEKD